MSKIEDNKVAIQNSLPVITAEYRLLAAIIQHNEYLDEIDPNVFVHTICKDIYQGIKVLIEREQPLTIPAIYQESSTLNLNVTQDIMTILNSKLSENYDNIEDIKNALAWAKKKVETKEILHQIEDILDSEVAISEESHKSISKALTEISSATAGIDIYNMPVMTMGDVMVRYKQAFIERSSGKRYLFGDAVLDAMITTGPEPGGGGTISAATGMGKTAYMCHLFRGFMRRGIPVMFFSLEMGLVTTVDRLIAADMNIPFADIVNPPEDGGFLALLKIIDEKKAEYEKNKKVRFCENPSLSLADIKREIKKFQAEIGQRYCVVMIDLLSMVSDFCGETRGANSAQKIEFAMNDLNAMSKELEFHYIGAVQQGRTIENSKVFDIDDLEKLRPTRSGIKNANAFLERPRYSIGLFRKKYYGEAFLPEDEEVIAMDDIIEVNIMKQNNGMVGRRKMLFNGPTFSLLPIKDEDSIDGKPVDIEEDGVDDEDW